MAALPRDNSLYRVTDFTDLGTIFGGSEGDRHVYLSFKVVTCGEC